MDDPRDDEPLPPPPEPPPLPEQPLGPPSMADEPSPPGQPGHVPPEYPPPPPTYPPPGQAAPGYPPPPPPPPPGYAPPGPGPQQQLGWNPPPYQPPPPIQKGPHGQPVFRGMECATWGSRVGAYLLDVLFAMIIPSIVGIALLASGVTGLEIAGGILLILALAISFPLYSAAFEARSGRRSGQTLGKQMVGIRVVRDGGEPIGFGFALLRELAVRWLLIGMVGGLFFFPPFLDLLWPLWDETNRALHDMVVSTHVVRADDPPTGPAAAGLPG